MPGCWCLQPGVHAAVLVPHAQRPGAAWRQAGSGSRQRRQQDPKGNRENAKEEEPSKSSGDSTVTETEEGKKIKAPKKQKFVREIPMELGVNDIPDLLEDEVKSLMKKDV